MAQDLKVAPGRHDVGSLKAPDSGTLHRLNRFGGNLIVDPCTGCSYDIVAGGYYVWGKDNCQISGTAQSIAVPFIAKCTGHPREISASINLDNTCTSGSNVVTLGIWTDNCGMGPGTMLDSARARVPQDPCELTVAKAGRDIELTKDTKYWVVAMATSPDQDGLSAIWYASNKAQIGYSLEDGLGWSQFSGLVPGFSVD